MASSARHPSTLIFLALPPKTLIGLDLISFDSSPNFNGISNLPAGLHFLYSGTDASLAIRQGRWLEIHSGPTSPPIQTLSWSVEEECLLLLAPNSTTAVDAARKASSGQAKGIVEYGSLQDASANLQTSASSETGGTDADAWRQLTSYITPSVLSRILPAGNAVDDAWTLSSVSCAPADAEQIPGLTASEVSSITNVHAMLNFSVINLKQTWPDEAVGRIRTDAARDRSWYLAHLIAVLAPDDRQAGAAALLGELQFCFLMVLTLANYSCLEQWKRILTVLFTCQTALVEVEAYFAGVVKVLRAQLGKVDDVEGGLFEMADEQGSAWLRQLLRGFRAHADEVLGVTDGAPTGSDSKGTLMSELKSLDDMLRQRYGWDSGSGLLRRGMVDLEDGERIEVQLDGVDEEDETGEYAPTVVEL